jgi:hypothetical protein
MTLIDYRSEDPASVPGTRRNSLQKMYEVNDTTLTAGPTLIPILFVREAALYCK